MKQEQLDLLKALTEVNGVPGYEARGAKIVEERLRGLCEIERDNLGARPRRAVVSRGRKALVLTRLLLAKGRVPPGPAQPGGQGPTPGPGRRS